MDNKEYDLGFLVGRFQIIHSGHEQIIRKAIELCGTTAVFVGSSQESGTAKNPFTYELREEMLRDIFKGDITVFPLPDLGAGNNCVWGNYVLNNVYEHFGRLPDLFISGSEDRRNSWFPPDIYPELTNLYIPKSIDISASRMREFIINNDFDSWTKYSNPVLWNRFPELRKIILRCSAVTYTASV